MDKLKKLLDNGETVILSNDSVFASIKLKVEKLTDGNYYQIFVGNNDNADFQSKVLSKSMLDIINEFCVDYDLDEATIDCVKCDGDGCFDVMDCHDQSNECCGGCFKSVECDEDGCEDGKTTVAIDEIIEIEY